MRRFLPRGCGIENTRIVLKRSVIIHEEDRRRQLTSSSLRSESHGLIKSRRLHCLFLTRRGR